jgi:hypothetical protein
MTNKELRERKLQYNELLLRHEKAVMFLDDTKVPLMQKEKWLPEFLDITKEMCYVIAGIEASGTYVTTENIINGFRVDEMEEEKDG